MSLIFDKAVITNKTDILQIEYISELSEQDLHWLVLQLIAVLHILRSSQAYRHKLSRPHALEQQAERYIWKASVIKQILIVGQNITKPP